jgi:hypothetical protein
LTPDADAEAFGAFPGGTMLAWAMTPPDIGATVMNLSPWHAELGRMAGGRYPEVSSRLPVPGASVGIDRTVGFPFDGIGVGLEQGAERSSR